MAGAAGRRVVEGWAGGGGDGWKGEVVWGRQDDQCEGEGDEEGLEVGDGALTA